MGVSLATTAGLAFVAGLLGSAHCLGMCGPFVLAIAGGTKTSRANLGRQALYSLGRIATYALLGAMAGFFGARLASSTPALLRAPAILAGVAGVVLVWQGLHAAGWIGKGVGAGGDCLATSFFGPLAKGRTALESFVAGALTGFLPCGLLYGMLAMAAASHDLLAGATTMAAFGLGTAPPLIALGWGASLLSLANRRRLTQVAAWCLVIGGCVSIARGAQAWRAAGKPSEPVCPYCSRP